jgi:hypothetical protein
MLLLIASLLSLGLGVAAFAIERADEAGSGHIGEVRHASHRR